MRTPTQRPRIPAAALSVALGASFLILTPLPAIAVPSTCDYGATLLSGDRCELRVNSGTTTITPTAQMASVEALLVGPGGGGYFGYGVGHSGQGGEVKVVGFNDDQPIFIEVGSPDTSDTSATQGSTQVTAVRGGTTNHSSSVGAGGVAPNVLVGGPGVRPSDISSATSLFNDDTTYYGGGGAFATAATSVPSAYGAGYVSDYAAGLLAPPEPNRGGGAGGGSHSVSGGAETSGQGASGVVVLRWSIKSTVTFELNGHGQAIPNQQLTPGDTPTQPTDPTEQGYSFNGWYTDSALTIPADFTTPLTANTTFYAKWTATAVVPPVNPTNSPSSPSSKPVEPSTEPADPTPVQSEPAATVEPSASSTPDETNGGGDVQAAEAEADGASDELAQSGAEVGLRTAMLSALLLTVAGAVIRRRGAKKA